jgi:hypothetical protein
MISEAFAKILMARRAELNQRVSEAQRRFPSFNTAAFAEFLATGVDSVLRSVDEAAPDRVAPVALVAYDCALELVGLALAGPGARSEVVGQVWQILAPHYARLVAEHPAEVLGALTNAALNLEQTPSARPDQWLREMAAMAARTESLAQLLALGPILAWRAGMSQLRIGAIEAGGQLPEPLALAAFGFGQDRQWKAVRERLLANPWWGPDSKEGAGPCAGREIGAFAGFGGAFFAPPEVRAGPDGFYVKSAERYSFLVADACGAVLHGATREQFECARPGAPDGKVAVIGSLLVIDGRAIELDLPANHIAISCNAHTVAVTSPFTHAIRLLPLQ